MSTVLVVYGTKSGCTAGIAERIGMWHASAKQWLIGHAAELKERPVALFTACLTIASDPGKTDEVRAYTDPLITESGVEPVDVGMFAGMNDPKAFSLPERLIMKAMKAPEGDFRDYEAVDARVRDVMGKLGV